MPFPSGVTNTDGCVSQVCHILSNITRKSLNLAASGNCLNAPAATAEVLSMNFLRVKLFMDKVL